MLSLSPSVLGWGNRRRCCDANTSIEELEGCSVYAAYTPDIPVSVEPGLVSLPVRRGRLGGEVPRFHRASLTT